VQRLATAGEVAGQPLHAAQAALEGDQADERGAQQRAQAPALAAAAPRVFDLVQLERGGALAHESRNALDETI
jgi:hypothetical protein